MSNQPSPAPNPTPTIAGQIQPPEPATEHSSEPSASELLDEAINAREEAFTQAVVGEHAHMETDVKSKKKKVKEEAKPRTCTIERALPASVIQLVKVAPHNDSVRTLILAHLKQPVPDEHKTFEDIKEWIETTIVIEEVAKKKAVDANLEIHIPIMGSDREHGTCRYSVNRQGQGDYRMSLRAFLAHVASSSDMEGLVDAITEHIGEDWEDYVRLESDGDYDHDTHETDSDEPYTDSDWDYRDGHRRHLTELIRQHAPQELTRLLDNE